MSIIINKIEVTENSEFITIDFRVPSASGLVLKDVNIATDRAYTFNDNQSIIGFFADPLGEDHTAVVAARDIGLEDLYGLFRFEIELAKATNLSETVVTSIKMISNLSVAYEVVLDITGFVIETTKGCNVSEILKSKELETSAFLNSLLSSINTALFLGDHDKAVLLYNVLFEEDCMAERIEGIDAPVRRIGTAIINDKVEKV